MTTLASDPTVRRPKECLRCGDVFEKPYRRNRRYCSKSCRNMSSEDRRKLGTTFREGKIRPLLPPGLDGDLPLIGTIRGNLGEMMGSLHTLSRRIDTEELSLRKAIDVLRTALFSEDSRNFTLKQSVQHYRELEGELTKTRSELGARLAQAEQVAAIAQAERDNAIRALKEHIAQDSPQVKVAAKYATAAQTRASMTAISLGKAERRLKTLEAEVEILRTEKVEATKKQAEQTERMTQLESEVSQTRELLSQKESQYADQIKQVTSDLESATEKLQLLEKDKARIEDMDIKTTATLLGAVHSVANLRQHFEGILKDAATREDTLSKEIASLRAIVEQREKGKAEANTPSESVAQQTHASLEKQRAVLSGLQSQMDVMSKQITKIEQSGAKPQLPTAPAPSVDYGPAMGKMQMGMDLLSKQIAGLDARIPRVLQTGEKQQVMTGSTPAVDYGPAVNKVQADLGQVSKQLATIGQQVSQFQQAMEKTKTTVNLAPSKEFVEINKQLALVQKDLQRALAVRESPSSAVVLVDAKTQKEKAEQMADYISLRISNVVASQIEAMGIPTQLKVLQSSLAEAMDRWQKERARMGQVSVDLSPILAEIKGLGRELKTGANTTELARIVERLGKWPPPESMKKVMSDILALIRGLEDRMTRELASSKTMEATSTSDKQSRKLEEKVLEYRRRIAELKTIIAKLSAANNLLMLAVERARAQIPPQAALGVVGDYFLEKLDLQNAIAKLQRQLGEEITESTLQDDSPRGRHEAARQAAHAARLHVLRSPRGFFQSEPEWSRGGQVLNQAGENAVIDKVCADIERLRKVYEELYERVHGE